MYAGRWSFSTTTNKFEGLNVGLSNYNMFLVDVKIKIPIEAKQKNEP